MSIKTTITCDFCGCVAGEVTNYIVKHPQIKRYDLCADCEAKFEKWMRGDGDSVTKSKHPGGIVRTAWEWAKAENTDVEFVLRHFKDAGVPPVLPRGLYDLDIRQQADLHNAVVAAKKKPQTYKYTTKKLAEMVKLPIRTVVRRLKIMGAKHEWTKINGHGAFLWEVDADQIKLLDDRRGVHAPNRMKPAGKPALKKTKGKAGKERLDWWKMSDLVEFYGVNRKSVKKAIDRTEGVTVRERHDKKNKLIHWKEYGMTDATCKSIGETLRKF